MKSKTMFMPAVVLALGLAIINFSCKKTGAAAADDQVLTVTSKTAVTGQTAKVQLTAGQLAQLKATGTLRVNATGSLNFSAVKGTEQVTEAGISIGGLNCPPVSQSTINYYQSQANSCCCSFIVCLQAGPGCLFYLYYFGPNNGCTGGGGELM